MNVKELFERLRIDGELVGNVIQIQVDADRTTVVYELKRDDTDPVQRVITVESEAVSFG